METTGDEPTRWDRGLGPLALAACVVLVVAHAALWWRDPPYNSDSWAFYGLSRTVFTSDFYRTTFVRQYQLDTPFGISFPPALPVAIALTDAALGVGWRAGFVLDHLLLLALLGALATLSWRAVRDVLPGAAAFALLLTFSPFSQLEVASGCSVTLALVWLVLLLHVLLGAGPARPLRAAAAAGLLAGLWVLTRFDFLLGAVALGGVVLARHGPRPGAAYGTALALGVSPWVVYSLARFGRPWISDNVRTVLLADTPYVTEYLPFPEVCPTLLSAPTEWLARKVPGVASVLLSTCGSATRSAVPALLALLVVAGVALRLARPAAAREVARAVVALPALRAWACLAPSLAVLYLSISLTGYEVERYNPPLLLWLQVGAVLALAAAARQLGPTASAAVRVGLAVLLVVVALGFARGLRPHLHLGSQAVVVAGLAGLAATRVRLVPLAGVALLLSATVLSGAALDADRLRDPTAPHQAPPWPEADVRALRERGARVLTRYVAAGRLAAEHGLQAYMYPRPIRPLTAFLFLERYAITHVVVGEPTFDAVVEEAFEHERRVIGEDVVLELRGRRPGVQLVGLDPPKPLPGETPDLRSARLAEVPGTLRPGSRLAFNGSGLRVVRAVEGRTVRLDFPLARPGSPPRSAQDGPPFPVLLLPPVDPR